MLRKELTEKRKQRANKERQRPIDKIEDLETKPDMSWKNLLDAEVNSPKDIIIDDDIKIGPKREY